MQNIIIYNIKQTGYGFYVNYGQATPLLEDMISLVERYKNDPDAPPSAKIYFGHAETVVPLIALLGLFEGPALTAEGFLLSKHRQDVHIQQFSTVSRPWLPGPDRKPNLIICEHLNKIVSNISHCPVLVKYCLFSIQKA